MVKQNIYEKILIHIIAYYLSAFLMVIAGILKFIKFILLNLYNILLTTETPSYNISDHNENLAKVQKQVKNWNENGKKTKMCTGRPGWKTLSLRTPIYKDTLNRINIDMNKIIYINTNECDKVNVVCVEPLLTIGELTYELGRQGWTLPVVPELNELTIGGLVCGAGLETSSHKYGLFHNICISYEFVLASGEVVKCTEKENIDLFHAIPGSHGTLGFLTAVELKIIPAKTHVKLEYIPVYSLDEAISRFEIETNREQGNEFVEGIMFSLNEGVIMVGEPVSVSKSGLVNNIGRWYKPWFYKHVESYLKNNINNNNEKLIEYIPLRDYYHRHTRGLFWETNHIIPYGNNIIFRYLFGWILPVRFDLIKLLVPKWIFNIFDSNHVTQDFVIPINKLKDIILLSHGIMQVYPIWLCPAKLINVPGACHFLSNSDEMYVDIGIYGMSKSKEYDIVKSARKLEMFCIENRGYQALYSDVCMTRDEFGQMFKPDLYLKVRNDYNCEDAFPDVYDKVCREARK